MKEYSRFVLIGLAILVLGGCEFLWDAGNRGALTADVKELLGNAGVTLDDLDCHMHGTTRSGACEARMDAEEVGSVVSGLKLVEVSDSESWDYRSWLEEGECGSREDLDARFRSERRAAELRLEE